MRSVYWLVLLELQRLQFILPGSSSTPIYSLGSSTPLRYSPEVLTPPSYSLGTSRNAECSNYMGFRFQNSLQSKIDQTSKISKSVFISNFPDDCSSRDLWKVCNGYGTVVDVFIPNKRSKAGKRFAFVRFINGLTLQPFRKREIGASGNVRVYSSLFPESRGPKEYYSSILKPSLVLDDSCCYRTDSLVDIEGVPVNAWMVQLVKRSVLNGEGFLARVQGKFLFGPHPSKLFPEKELFSGRRVAKFNEQANNLNNDEGFEHQHGESNDKEVSSDPFNIYDLLDKRTKEVRTTDTSTSIPYPPGFTPANDIPACNNQDIPEAESVRPPSRSARSNSRVLEEAENSVDRVSSESFSNGVKIKEGGSILEILEEMITVGQTMGFSMEGCTKDMEKIIGTQGEQLVFR
ncbi:RNA-directed DNA polymerase, eukaryota [Tanacetum coccineum]